MVLQQPPKNALEAVLRYMPMPVWPQDITRAGFLAHRSGDPGVLTSRKFGTTVPRTSQSWMFGMWARA